MCACVDMRVYVHVEVTQGEGKRARGSKRESERDIKRELEREKGSRLLLPFAGPLTFLLSADHPRRSLVVRT